jgi:hypothetical protein
MALMLLCLTFFAKLRIADEIPDSLFDLTLGLVSGTHVASVSLVGL